MNLFIDFRSGIPIYLQLVAQIKQLVQHGILKPGVQLPPLRKLAEELGVNFNTVARAYRILEGEEIITTQHGRGTYVLDFPAPAALPAAIRREALEELTRRFVAETKRMGFEIDMVEAVFEYAVAEVRKGEQDE
jgi:GntR family transcriptional regulator